MLIPLTEFKIHFCEIKKWNEDDENIHYYNIFNNYIKHHLLNEQYKDSIYYRHKYLVKNDKSNALFIGNSYLEILYLIFSHKNFKDDLKYEYFSDHTNIEDCIVTKENKTFINITKYLEMCIESQYIDMINLNDNKNYIKLY